MIDILHTDFAGYTQKLRDVRDLVCEIVAVCAVIANRVPRYEAITRPKLQWAYRWLVVAPIAFCACNWRKHLPSLNLGLGQFKQPTECAACKQPMPQPSQSFEGDKNG